MEFYPTEEIKTQVEQYFDAPEEDDVAENGTEEIVHNVEMKEVDRTFLTDRVEGIVGKIPELDARIDEVAQLGRPAAWEGRAYHPAPGCL